MRILIVSTFFPPLNSIASLRPHSWAKYWTQHGHDVTVLTTKKQVEFGLELDLATEGFKIIEVPEHPWLQKLKKGNRSYPSTTGTSKKSWFGTFLHWLRFRRGVFNATRMPDFTHLWIKPALRALNNEKPYDLVVSTAGPYPVHLIANRLKKKGKADSWIADYRDAWSDNHIYPGVFPFNAIEKRLENRILANANAITTVSAPISNWFQTRFPNAKITTIENGFDPDDLKGLDSTPIFPQDGKIRIVHTGSIYIYKIDPSPLFQTLEKLSKQKKLCNNLEIIFIGFNNGNLQQLIDKYQVGKWVKMGGFHNRKNALRMQRDADFLLFFPWNDSSVDGILTGKLFEYLFSGTPIIAVGCPHKEASQRIIEEANAGTLLSDTKQIERFFSKLTNKKTTQSKIVNQNVLNRYLRETLALKLLNTISQEAS